MSHTPSRSGTPVPGSSRRSPSRLSIPPSLRPSPSVSSLHIHGHNIEPSDVPPIPPLPSQGYGSNPKLESSASSVITVDTNEGILLRDVDAETEDTEEVAVLRLDSDTDKVDEGSKQTLRDHLRKALTHKTSQSDVASRPSFKGKMPELNDISFNSVSRYPPREYYVLTDAGKPVFVSRYESESSDNVAATIGVMQALISVFLDDNDKLKCIIAGRTRINFLLRSPLYYACVSSWGEPESVTRSHLEYLHLQILSIVTAVQLRRIFERRTNFDLRRLLNGAEGFLTSVLNRLEFDLAMSSSSLHCLKMDANLRKRVAEALVPTSKMKEILYVLLVGRGRVITLIRPRKHSIHPADIHILLNTVHSPSIINSPAATSWIPLCLPKFNPSGFVNAYISFLRKDGAPDADQSVSNLSTMGDSARPPDGTPTQGFYHPTYAAYDDLGLALVCISGGGEFDTIRGWCDNVTKRLEQDGILNAISASLYSGQTEYSFSDLGIPGLRHFVYKSRPHVQITAPVFEDPYNSLDDKRRLITLYHILYDAIHAKSGQKGPLKLQYIKTDKESVMGWITQPFELYIALSPRLPKSAAVGAANAVARWVKKEEAKLFLKDAPVF